MRRILLVVAMFAAPFLLSSNYKQVEQDTVNKREYKLDLVPGVDKYKYVIPNISKVDTIILYIDTKCSESKTSKL